MTRTETKSRRAKENDNDKTEYICWKKLLHKFFPLALNRLLFLRMRYLKWMRIFKKWFNRSFPCSGMKLESLLSTGIK